MHQNSTHTTPLFYSQHTQHKSQPPPFSTPHDTCRSHFLSSTPTHSLTHARIPIVQSTRHCLAKSFVRRLQPTVRGHQPSGRKRRTKITLYLSLPHTLHALTACTTHLYASYLRPVSATLTHKQHYTNKPRPNQRICVVQPWLIVIGVKHALLTRDAQLVAINSAISTLHLDDVHRLW